MIGPRGRRWPATMIATAAALTTIAAPVPAARADERTHPRLFPTRLPFRPRLAMRTPPVAGTAPVTGTAPVAAADPPLDPLRFDGSRVVRRRARSRRPGEETRVRAQLTTGFALDGAAPTGAARTLAGQPIADGPDDLTGYARARAYGFGALYLGGRNLVTPGLAGYLAAQARLRPIIPDYAPVATAWDQVEAAQVNSAWAEAVGAFTTPALRPLAIRAGRQYVYGPFIAHLDGLHLRWHHGWFDASIYTGSRVPDWSARTGAPRGLGPQRGVITGAEVAIELPRRTLPVTVRLRALAYENHGHTDLTINARLRRALDLTALARTFDGAIAHEQLTVRYRLSDRTRLVIDATYRHRRDPLWDLAYRDGHDPDDPSAARRYLDLGPLLPRATIRARAGTVLLDNVDLLLSGGAAFDARSSTDPTPSLYAAGWLEGGGALEVRVRRTFALGISGLARTYNRRDPEPADIVVDVEDQVQPLSLTPGKVGESSLFEGGVSARFSGGARKFSVTAEVYGRQTRYTDQYIDDGVVASGGLDLEATDLIKDSGFRGGGRITLDAWITERVRLRGEYDLTTGLEVAPEVSGLKSLRIVAEGTL